MVVEITLSFLIFVIPVTRFLLWFRRDRVKGGSWSSWNAYLGGIERRLSRARGFLVGCFLVVVTLEVLHKGAPIDPWRLAWYLSLLALLALARGQRRRSELRLMEFVRTEAWLLPDEFFDFADRAFGPWGFVPVKPRRTQRPSRYDFRQPGLFKSFGLLSALADSAWLTRMLLKAEHALGVEYFEQLIDPVARLWGARVLQVARGSLVTEAFEKITALGAGRRLFVMNHVSQTDFALLFPAFDGARGSDKAVAPRFVVAKDHFIDNPFIHSFMGIGRAAELAGMIPVDRRDSKRAIVSMENAARMIAEKPVDLAIYPQGTRSRVHIGEDGRIIGEGFYNSSRRVREPLAHIKKGTAFLILDLLRLLAPARVPLHVIVVGIEGAGCVLPRSRWRMNWGREVVYRVHEVMTLIPTSEDFSRKRDDRGEITEELRLRAEHLRERLERSLAGACRIDERLGESFEKFFARSMPKHQELSRIFDTALSLSPKRREKVFEALAKVPENIDSETLEGMYRLLGEAMNKKF